jgi:endonuclease/exonuclease/phosphatase family metal-dependent hydrolase
MPLRIATFNLKDFFLPRSDAERGVAVAKFSNVSANLRRANADVVALQEVGEEQMLERLASDLADLGYGTPVIGTADKRGIRNAILSRVPVLWSQVHTQKTLPFPHFIEGDEPPFVDRIPLRRGIVHVRIESPELGELDVLTAHFKSNLPVPLKTLDGRELEDKTPTARAQSALRSLVQRAAEAIFVRKLVDDIFVAQPDHAVCVLGDLNDRDESLPVRVVRGLGEPTNATLRTCAELIDAERRYSCFHGNEKSLIDHILVSERLFAAARSFEIYNEALRYHGPHVEPVPPTEDSDHALCVAEFAA